MKFILAKIWRLIRGPLQWYVLWIFHDKFMVGMSGVIFNEDKDVLLLQHRFWRADSWGLPSGYMNKSEQAADGWAREIFEETGYSISNPRLLEIASGYRLRLELHFVAEFAGGTLKLDPKEVLNAQFFPINDLPSSLLSSHLEIIQKAIDGESHTNLTP